MTRHNLSIHGGSVLVIGDTHFTNAFVGSHKDYPAESIELMKSIYRKAEGVKNLKSVIFLGDLIGVKEQNLRSRLFLSEVMSFFKRLATLCNRNGGVVDDSGQRVCPVLSVKGNHDMGGREGYTDFEFLIDQGLLVNPGTVDIYSETSGNKEARLHFVNWGDENERPSVDKTVPNVILAHGEFIVPGQTDIVPGGPNNIDLTRHKPFRGIGTVISGHIHTSSEQEIEFVNTEGSTSVLFYPGSPARVSERVEDVYYMVLSSSGEGVELESLLFNLPPVDEVFNPIEPEEIDEFADKEHELRTEKLEEILGEVMSKRLSQGDLISQINRVPYVSEESKTLAKKYLQIAAN